MDIEINTLGDNSDTMDIHNDLDIFSGGKDADTNRNTRVPNLSEVETAIRVPPATKSNEGIASKVSNFLGFGMSADSSHSERLKTDIDASDEKWGGYSKVNTTSVRTGYSAADPTKKARPSFTESKRYYLEKIGFFIRKLNEIRETQTSTEISAYNTMEEIKAEFEELRDEYKMAAAIAGYGKTIISGAASLEALGGFIDGFPLKTDGLENAISLSMNECSEEFEQIYERYGSIEVNPLVVVGSSIISTIIKTHLAHSFMDMYGPGFENDPEINNILQERANQIGNVISKSSTADLASSLKNATPINNKTESKFQSGFHFADEIIHKNGTHGGPPPPISTKITKPPVNEETAEQIKKMGQTERPAMKGPSALPNVEDFLGALSKPETKPPVSAPIESPPVPIVVPPPPPGKKSRGRKTGSSSISIDI